MTWDEHLAWCKKRAFEYADAGDYPSAVSSMANDIMKHPETKMSDAAIGTLVMVAMMHLTNGDTRGVREWIEGFR